MYNFNKCEVCGKICVGFLEKHPFRLKEGFFVNIVIRLMLYRGQDG